jgi:hypothetical protein
VRSRSSTADAAEVIVIAYETAYVPGASGKAVLIREGERRPLSDPDVQASLRAWYRDGHRAEFVRDRDEQAEALEEANRPVPEPPPVGWDQHVRAIQDFNFDTYTPITHEKLRVSFQAGDIVTKADRVFVLHPEMFEDVDEDE